MSKLKTRICYESCHEPSKSPFSVIFSVLNILLKIMIVLILLFTVLRAFGLLPSAKGGYRDIQSDSRRKANILGGENIHHSDKKISYDHISNSACLRRERDLFESEITRALRVVHLC